ncbi:MAG: metal ABC transporter ATP-binding protein [Candidatus Ratteibacteria bacterium]
MKNIIFDSVSVARAGRVIINNVSFTVKKGECVALYGPNGAGKTTILNLINGLLFAFQGKIVVGDTPITKKTALSVQLVTGYVPQNFEVDSRIPILAKTVVLSGIYGKLGLFHHPSRQHLEKARKIMELFEIDHIFDRPFGQISGGEKQKAMIARALMQKPEILLLDEPFSSISESSKWKILEIIKHWKKEKNITILIVSHERQIIEKLCNRILFIEEGKLISEQSIDGNL